MVDFFLMWSHQEVFKILSRRNNSGAGQHLERPIFRNFEISNINIMKVKSIRFSYSQIYSLFLCLFKLFEHSEYI